MNSVFQSPVTQPERSGRFAKKEDKCLSAASFCPPAKRLRSGGDPEGKEPGRPFSRFRSLGEQREEVVVWGRNPKVFGLGQQPTQKYPLEQDTFFITPAELVVYSTT